MGRAGAAYTASQGGSASTDPSAPVRVGYLPITNATPLLIGHANGYDEKAGVPVQAPVLFRSWSSLVGESIAIPAWWSVHNVVVQQMLRGAGLTPIMRRTPSADEGTVQLLPMAPSDMLPALNNGVIGGYTVVDPFNAAAAAQSVGGSSASWAMHGAITCAAWCCRTLPRACGGCCADWRSRRSGQSR